MKSKHYTFLRFSVTLFTLVFSSIQTFSQTKINDGTVSASSLPDASAILEVESTNKGFLLSRVSLTTTTTWGLAGAAPVAGMLVYNSNAAITAGSTSFPIILGGIGCYYWNGSGWVAIKMDIPQYIADTTYWKLRGNAGTNGNVNFLGTTDDHPVTFKVNNTKAGYLDSASSDKGSTSFGLNAMSGVLASSAYNNTAVGTQSLQNLTSGGWNTAIGHYAMQANTTGGTNTAVGQYALGAVQSGWNNTAVGQAALGANLSSNNTAFGQGALLSNTWGTNNVAVGQSALNANITGSSNVAVGQDALRYGTAGTGNIGIGLSALQGNTASYTIGIGDRALLSNTTGTGNTATGSSALQTNTTGNNNAAFGNYSLVANTTGNNNTALGYNALLSNTTGADNAVLGYNAMANNTTGYNNVVIGSSAGATLATGANNILIGYGTNVTGGAVNNTMNIGTTIYGINTTTAPSSSNTGRKVGINNSAPTSTLQVTGSLALPIATTTSNVTLDETHYTMIITGGTPTITLPAAASYSGRIYVIVNQTAGARTISTYIPYAGGTSTTVATVSAITVQSNGTSWYRIH